VGQAVFARAAWLEEHPSAAPYRFGNDSDPCWSRTAQQPYARPSLRALSDAGLIWSLGMEVERLLRLTQTSPALLGQCAWVAAILGASAHVAQVYHELRRHYHAPRARAMLREALRWFVEEQAEAARPLVAAAAPVE
jgi:hypothetical protein